MSCDNNSESQKKEIPVPWFILIFALPILSLAYIATNIIFGIQERWERRNDKR